MRDPYVVLGVARTATPSEIVDAYRAQLRAHHPDLHAGADPGPDDRLRQVLAAYRLLRDPQRRAAYDRAHPPPRAVERDSTPPRRTAREPPLLWAGPVRWHRR